MNFKKLLKVLPVGMILYISLISCANATGNILKVEIFNKPANFSRTPVIVNNRILVPAQDFIQSIGGVVSAYDPLESIQFKKDDKKVDMYFASNFAYVNGVKESMDVEPIQQDGMVMVPIRSIAEFFNIKIGWFPENSTVSVGGDNIIPVRQYGSANPARAYKVVIDPGHGGEETGAIVGNVMEKDLNLDIALRVEKVLKSKGIATYMTRTDDSYVSLYERSGFANAIGADLFVSIHNNAGTSDMKGTMTLYHPNYSRTTNKGYNTYTAAEKVQRAVTGELGTNDLGLIERPHLAVLRTSDMPAILVEVGFMTNKKEMRNLLNQDYRQGSANAIADGILDTLN